MKGLRLFVRPIEASDHDSVQAFLDQQWTGAAPGEGRSIAASGDAQPPTVPACGLLGKLLGELVAVLAMQITADAVVIDHILVARDLRRKRVARAMLAELEQIASKIDRSRLMARGTNDAPEEFFRRVGFEREGPWWVRHLRS